MQTSSCPSGQQLLDYLLGKRNVTNDAAIGEHLTTCPCCLGQVDDLCNAEDKLVSALQRAQPDDRYLGEQECESAIARCRSLSALLAPTVDHIDPATVDVDDGLPELADYEVLGRIGAGGMGAVYKAQHKRLAREIAIKVLPADRMADPHAVQRFRQEVLAGGKLLSHPNVVTVYDARQEKGRDLLIMEYVDGQNLSTLVHNGGPLNVEDAVECVLQAARGLDYAHKAGVVHRDIKPANLMFATNGMVKVLDLGLAHLDDFGEVEVRQANSLSPGQDLTNSGQMMGSVRYMSPEQGLSARQADARSDIYSLGCTLYFLLTGTPPYGGASVTDILAAHCEAPIPAVSAVRQNVSPKLDRIFSKMLAKNPADRQQSMSEVISDLEAILQDEFPDRDLMEFFQRLSKTNDAVGGGPEAVRVEETTPDLHADTQITARPRTGPAPSVRGLNFPVIVASIFAGTAALLLWTLNGRPHRHVPRQAPLQPALRIACEHTVSVLPAGNTAALAFAPHSTKLVITEGNLIRLWDATTGLCGPPWTAPDGQSSFVRCVAFNPYGTLLVSGSDDSMVNLWSTADGRLVQTLPEHTQPVLAADFSADGAKMVTSGDDALILVWEVENWKPRVLGQLGGAVHSLDFSPVDSNILLSASADPNIQRWNLETDESISFDRYHETVSDIAFSPDGKHFVSSSGVSRGVLRWWDVTTGEPLASFFEGLDEIRCLAYSSNNNQVATGETSGRVLLWNLANGQRQVLAGYRQPVSDVAFSTDGGLFVSAAEGGPVKVRYLENGHSRQLNGAAEWAWSVALSHDGQTLAAACGMISDGSDGFIRLWDATSGREQATLCPFENDDSREFARQILSLAYSPTDHRIAAGDDDGSVTLWDMATKTVRSLDGHAGEVKSVVFSPDGQTVASAGADQSIVLRQWNSGAQQIRMLGHTQTITALAFTHNGQTLASASHDGTIRIWNTKTGQERFTRDHGDSVTCLTLSPDGKKLCSGGHSGRIRVWDMQSGQAMRVFKAHVREISAIRFLTDGRTLVSAGYDRKIKLWNTDSALNTPMEVLAQHTDAILDLAVAPGGSRFVSASRDGSLRLWKPAVSVSP